jgi:hypothetical protein
MLLALLLMTMGVQEQPAGDPLAPAREGKIRCVEPDTAARNCRSIIRYSVHDDGSFDATVSGFVGDDGATVIVYQTSGAIEGDAVCLTVRPYDLFHGTLYRGGKPLSDRDAALVQNEIRIQLQDLAGKKRCYIDQVQGGQLVSNVTLDGVVVPELARPVAWISPRDGYALSR